MNYENLAADFAKYAKEELFVGGEEVGPASGSAMRLGDLPVPKKQNYFATFAHSATKKQFAESAAKAFPYKDFVTDYMIRG